MRVPGWCRAGFAAENRTLTDTMDAPMMSAYSRGAARWPPLGTPAERGGAFDTDAAEGGYGAFVSVAALAPGLLLPLLPFRDRFQALQNALAMPNMVTVICYTRDQGPCGRVVLNNEVRPPRRCSHAHTCMVYTSTRRG